MAALQTLFIIFLQLQFNVPNVCSQTNTSSPTHEPTNEPTAEPTLEPTLNPLFTLISSTINHIPNFSSTTNPAKSSSSETFIEKNYLWLIIGGSALLCICLIILVFIIRNKTHNKLQTELKKTNQAIENDNMKDEEKPINVNNNNNNIYGDINNYEQQLNMQQRQQLQQMSAMQQYQQNTNFQRPQAIAAYQALQFAPPINHSGDTWKNLNHLNPQQRMLQLMHQQQYIQQMANQAAVAMSYFIEQQIQQKQQLQQNNPQTLTHRQKVASLSYENNIINANRMSMPMHMHSNQNQNMQQRQVKYGVSAPHNYNNNNLMDPVQLQPKQRLDTMDAVALGSDDLPPSIAEYDDNVLNNEPGNMIDNEPGNVFYESGHGEMDNENDNDNDNDNEHEMAVVVPPPNPMQIGNLNIVKQQPNMRKIESLPQEIPDLPFGNSDEQAY